MSKGNTTEANVIAFIFQATAFPAYGGIYYVALHTADPGEAGTQATAEATYTDYARVAVTRDAAGWDVAGNQADNDDILLFPEANASFSPSTQTITHVSIGLLASGAGQILYSGALTVPIIVAALVTPTFPANTLVVQED